MPGKDAAVKVTVTASGRAATGVKVCATVPARLKPKVKAPGCRTIGLIANGQTTTASFKAKTTRRAKGNYAVRITASGDGLAASSARVRLIAKD